MDRKEFFKLLEQAKINCGKTTTDISFDLRMQWSTLKRFENGTSNSNLKKVLDYLRVIGYKIVVTNDSNVYYISNYESLVNWIVYARKNIYSQRELADKINITPITIANVERKTNVISIDNFLKIVDALNWELNIESV